MASSEEPKLELSRMSCVTVRLRPGEEIVSKLVELVKRLDLSSAFIITCVGSITHGRIRLANSTATNRNEIIDIKDKHEIVSLVGTLSCSYDQIHHSESGTCHLHCSLSDSEGKTIGGHVIELYVFTTAEIVVGTAHSHRYQRPHDPATGFGELAITPVSSIS